MKLKSIVFRHYLQKDILSILNEGRVYNDELKIRIKGKIDDYLKNYYSLAPKYDIKFDNHSSCLFLEKIGGL